jgi:DNA-dependent RNA polymerase auxiliary subunit epsilon
MEDADFGKFRTSLAETFQYIKYSKEDEALEKAVNENPNFRSLDRRTAELINEVTGSRLEYEKKKEVVDVCKAIEDMKKKAVEEGKNKSIEQMLLKGRTPEAIADFCGYDIEEVRKVAEKMSSPA